MATVGKPLHEELYDYFDYSTDTVTVSGFVQACDKILPDAFELLFRMYEREYAFSNLYCGYRLFAVDGSDLNISYDSLDKYTFRCKGDVKGCNQYHINAAYDILNI